MPAPAGLIRQFQPEDADSCCKLVCACLRTDPLMPPAAVERLLLAESPAAMRERANLFYLAVCIVEDRIAGVAGIDMNEIRLLYVDPIFHGRGVGGALLAYVESMVPPALFSDVFVYSAPGAVDFYRAHGYEPGGEHGIDVGGAVMATIFMTRRLAG
jgi:GNAT superfamily N-acetyltransferase